MRGVLVLLIASSTLALAAGEWALAYTRANWVVFHPPVCFRRDLYQRWDPYGYRLWPSRVMHQPHPGPPPRTLTYTSKADGFRDRERDAADPRPRIVITGDSLTFGIGVEAAERFTEQPEAREPGWRVENLGMIGYGPDLMVRALEATAFAPPPKVVVLALFTDDWRRVVSAYAGAGFPIPRFVLRDGALVSIPYPAPWPWERLRLYQGLAYLGARYTRATFALNGAILDRFLARARTDGVAPVLAFLPGPREGADDRRRRDWLADFAQARGVTYVDLGRALAPLGPQAFLPEDSHLAVAGHAAVAAALRPLLAPLVGEAATHSRNAFNRVPCASSACSTAALNEPSG